MNACLLVSLLSFIILPSMPLQLNDDAYAPPEYYINMDVSADLRWRKPCNDLGEYAVILYDNIYTLFPEIVDTEVGDILLKWFEKNAVDPYRSELYFFANCTTVPLNGLIFINLLYDIFAACTSIIAQDVNDIIIHGRNWDAHVPELRNMTFVAHFTNNNGDILYDGTAQIGYVGLWTGYKLNEFTVTGDAREQGSVLENIKSMHDDYWPVGWLIRDVIANQKTYNDALYRLQNEKLMAPAYYILGGLYYPDGAVITRNQTHSIKLWTINNETNYLNWYLVETNYDWWTPAPTTDDRRDYAIKYMNEYGENEINTTNLYNVLSTPPVLDNQTIVTVIMSASNSSLYYNMIRPQF